MLFVQLVIRNLAGRKVHAALTILTLAIAVAATILLFGASWGFADASTASFERRGVDIVVTRSGVVERANSSLRADQAHILSKLTGVAAVDGTLQETVSLKTKGFAAHPHLLLGQDPRGFSLQSLQMQTGQTLAAEDRGCVLIGVGLAASLAEKLNESIEIEGRNFRIAGIFLSENPVETNLLISPLADVQQLMDRPGQVTQFEVQVDKSHANADAIRALCQQIEALRDDADQSLGLQALPVREFVGSGTRNRLATAMAWGTTSIAMVLASLGILNTLLVSVQERTREIGVLRALGWPRTRVLRMILLESFALGLLAILSGAVLAVVTAVIIARFPTIREITGPLITRQALLCGAVPAGVAILLGGFYPAWHAASIPATEALRYE